MAFLPFLQFLCSSFSLIFFQIFNPLSLCLLKLHLLTNAIFPKLVFHRVSFFLILCRSFSIAQNAWPIHVTAFGHLYFRFPYYATAATFLVLFYLISKRPVHCQSPMYSSDPELVRTENIRIGRLWRKINFNIMTRHRLSSVRRLSVEP